MHTSRTETSRISDEGLELAVSIRLKHRQGAVVIDAPGGRERAGRIDRALVRAVCLARSWAKALAAGEIGSTRELARKSGLCNHYAARLMPLAWLAPDLSPQSRRADNRGHSLSARWSNAPCRWTGNEQRRLFEGIG